MIPQAGGGVTLVTGAEGFVGRHLLAALEGERVIAPSRAALDLLDAAAVRAAVEENRPAVVYHLAALASVARSWEDPAHTIQANVAMTANLLEAVRMLAPEATVVMASSGEVYGPPGRLPVDERAPLRPQNPYAVSKAACDLLAGEFADAHGLHVVRLRSFNLAGPGQSDTYVLASLAHQVAEAERGGRDEFVLSTGDVTVARDFTDVRDVARAYVAASRVEAGAFNVCSERATRIETLIELLGQASTVRLRHEVDPGRLRSGEVPEVRGSAERLRSATGWRPEIPLDRTVRDTLEDWRSRVAVSG